MEHSKIFLNVPCDKVMLAHLRPFRWNPYKTLNLEKTLSKYTPILWKFCPWCFFFYYQRWALDFLILNLRMCKRSCSYTWKWWQRFLEAGDNAKLRMGGFKVQQQRPLQIQNRWPLAKVIYLALAEYDKHLKYLHLSQLIAVNNYIC